MAGSGARRRSGSVSSPGSKGWGQRKSRNYRSRSEGPAKHHSLRRAEEIVAEGAKHFGFTGEELRQNRRGDWRRSAVAWAIAKETSVPQKWIAEHLNQKTAANASQQIRRFHQVPEKELPKEVRGWKWSRNVA